MSTWCQGAHKSLNLVCPAVLGVGISTNDPRLCSNNNFWRQQTCGKHGKWYALYTATAYQANEMIRCQAAKSGQCVKKEFWGLEGAKDRYGNGASCKDGNDLYRPIKEAGQRSQATKPHNQKCGKQSQRQRMTRDVNSGQRRSKTEQPLQGVICHRGRL